MVPERLPIIVKIMKQYIFITGDTYSDNYCSPDGQLIIVFPTSSTTIKNIKMYDLETCMSSPQYSGSYCKSDRNFQSKYGQFS